MPDNAGPGMPMKKPHLPPVGAVRPAYVRAEALEAANLENRLPLCYTFSIKTGQTAWQAFHFSAVRQAGGRGRGICRIHPEEAPTEAVPTEGRAP